MEENMECEKMMFMSLSDYDELVKCSAKIEAVERLINSTEYIGITEKVVFQKSKKGA
mgnify:CR=1 FL=1